MKIEAGQDLLHYRLVDKIGEGGMGVVWRATDTTLNRDVAIKLLPPTFAEDPERLARFEREAVLLASLNHPNIASIYGLHEAPTDDGNVRFLAMEIVDGEDLSQRLVRGPLPVDQVLEVAVQMAAAIEAAHDKGVVHRDLKPANVIVSSEGRVKVLDFGLAKAFEADPAGSDPSFSPTMTSHGTVAGVILGTAAYMSPEQARGRAVDRRTDLWSFGCVLYECLVGRSLFGGETVSDSLAAILRKDPDWSTLPADTPPMVRLLIRRCLARDPNKRLRDAGDARIELEQAIEDPRVEALGLPGPGEAGTAAVVAAAARSSRARRLFPWAVAALALSAAATLALRGPASGDAPATTKRLTIPVEGATRFGDPTASPPAVSPDGRYVVFGMTDDNDVSQLWLRPFDSFEARPLDGTEGGNYAFWSPDSLHVGFFVDGGLKRVEIASGRVQPIANESSSSPRGGTWGTNGKILFAPNSNTGIWIVDAAGGAIRQLTTPDPEIPDASHRWPHFLPDGDHFLYLLWTNDIDALEAHGGVYLSSLSGDAPPIRILTEASSMAYAPPGHVLAMQADNLIAVPFDLDARKAVGGAVVVANDVLHSRNNGHAAFSVSAQGTLVYACASAIDLPSTLHWYDRAGETTDVPIDPAPFFGWLRLAPDGRRAVTTLPGTTGDGEVWVVDLVRGVRTRLTPSAPWTFSEPAWSPTGDRVMYAAPKLGSTDFFVRNVDGSGDEQPVLTDKQDKRLNDWASDGRTLVYWPIGAGTGTADLWLHDLETKESTVLIAGSPSYVDAVFSHDARYVAYASDESGRSEIFIQQIDGGARWQASTGGGVKPHWSADGREIVYLDTENRMIAVSVDIPGGMALGTPVALFTVGERIVGFDATANHDRFLFATREETESAPLHVILNWNAHP